MNYRPNDNLTAKEVQQLQALLKEPINSKLLCFGFGVIVGILFTLALVAWNCRP